MNTRTFTSMSSLTMTDRELDAEIAEKVMGWTCDRDSFQNMTDDAWDELRFNAKIWHCPDTQCVERLNHWSTEIEDAWDVVEKLIGDGYELSEAGYSMTTKKWDFTFGNGCSFPCPLSDTAPRAICLAALAALDETIK